eukprot:gene15018-17749_t
MSEKRIRDRNADVEPKDVPLDHSLRKFLELIYLDAPYMTMYIQGVRVKTQNLLKEGLQNRKSYNIAADWAYVPVDEGESGPPGYENSREYYSKVVARKAEKKRFRQR